MGELRNSYEALISYQKRRDHVADIGVDERKIFRWVVLKIGC
jgi:hypothetical protein